MICVPIVTLIFLLWTTFGLVEEEFKGEKISRKIKGQHYVIETMVTKVVGAEGLSDDLMEIVRSDSHNMTLPQNATLVVGAKGFGIPALVTESVKTTVTKIMIPLSITFMDNEWYCETLKKFLLKNKIALRGNDSEQQFSHNGTDVRLILLKLFSAAKLRHNVLTVFGHLLYHPRQILPEALYESLTVIKNAIRLCRVPLLECLNIAEKMSTGSLHNQFITLFEQLESLVPKQIRSSVTYWLECLQHGVVNIDDMLNNSTGTINFLSGTDPSELSSISKRVLFPESTVSKSSQDNEELFGKTLSYVFTEISERSITLTPKLFAGILAHLPVNLALPEVDENKQFAVEVLKQDEGNTFDKIVSKIKFEEVKNPFEIMLQILIYLKETNYFVNNNVPESIILGIDRSITPYASINYPTELSIFTSEHLESIFGGIVREEYSSEAVDAKNRIVRYMNENKADFEACLLGLNKYFYKEPNEVLLAILTRISIRTKVNIEVTAAAETLKNQVLLKCAINRLRLAVNIPDIITLLTCFQSTSTLKEVKITVSELKVLMHLEKVNLQHILIGYRMENCNVLQTCIINVLNLLISNNKNRNEKLMEKMNEVIKMVGFDRPADGQHKRSLRDVSEKCFFCQDFGLEAVVVSSGTEESLTVMTEIS